jgi:hypothetical protein
MLSFEDDFLWSRFTFFASLSFGLGPETDRVLEAYFAGSCSASNRAAIVGAPVEVLPFMV